jgi:hypothetical protein
MHIRHPAGQDQAAATVTEYAIQLTDMKGNTLTDHVGGFGSDIEACAAARRLLRPGQRATIMAGQRLVGRVSLAVLLPHGVAPHEAPGAVAQPGKR